MEILLSHPFLDRQNIPKVLLAPDKESKNKGEKPYWFRFFGELNSRQRKRGSFYRWLWEDILIPMIKILLNKGLMEFEILIQLWYNK